MLVGAFAERAPQHVDGLRKVGLLDHHVGPDSIHQLGLRNDLAGVLDKMEQRVEDPWGQLDPASVDAGTHHALRRIEFELAEYIDGTRPSNLHVIPRPEFLRTFEATCRTFEAPSKRNTASVLPRARGGQLASPIAFVAARIATTIRRRREIPTALAGLILSAPLAWCLPANADAVTQWNAITLACVQGPPNPPNRGGPPGLLDIALVQAAVHDAVQAIEGRFDAYEYANPAMLGVGSPAAAAASASYGVLVGLYGADDPCLVGVVNPAVTYAGDAGLQAGAAAAAALLPLYRPIFAMPTDPFVGGTEPGEWRLTPGVTQGANTWMAVTAPFAMNRPSQFRPERQPPLTSERYAREYNEVKSLGSLSQAPEPNGRPDRARPILVRQLHRAVVLRRCGSIADEASTGHRRQGSTTGAGKPRGSRLADQRL